MASIPRLLIPTDNRLARATKLKDDEQGSTYRGVYCVLYKEAVYVLHAFQKKSKSGRADPPEEIKSAKARAKWAEMMHRLWELDQAEKAKGQKASSPKKKGGKP